jgi:hypothetical protein
VLNRNLSGLHFPLLRSWQKRRFLPAETKLMSDKRAGARLVDRRSTRRVPSKEGRAQKAPQATFSNEPGSVFGEIRLAFLEERAHSLDAIMGFEGHLLRAALGPKLFLQ